MYGGGGSNPPWQRNSLGNAGMQNLQSQMSLSNSNIVGYHGTTGYNQNIGMNQQGNLPLLSSMGSGNMNQMNTNQMYSQTMSYPSSRDTLNMNVFSQSNQNEGTIMNNNSNNLNCKKIGTVTKMVNVGGFVDEEIFFFKNVCKGALPKIGDQVLVEAYYNSSTQYKWHATRVQLVTSFADGDQNVGGYGSSISSKSNLQINQRTGSGYNAAPSSNVYTGWSSGFERTGSRNRNVSPVRLSLDRYGRNNESRYDDDDIDDRRRRREEREKEKNRFREKRDNSIDKGGRFTKGCISPIRRIPLGIPRYNVQVPKITLNMLNADLLEVRRRYANLYIPSDFFFTQIRWCESFPLNSPFSLQKPCSFHIMHKDIEPINKNNADLEPSDADSVFSAKVMLMGIPPMSEVYRRCFTTAEEKDPDDDREFMHPSRLINFLVGIRGKNDAIAIGGPWSPSLDGPNPAGDPSVLIRTAIRTCKALTGIDLSPCTQWYRFVELYYHRSETTHKGRTRPAHIKTVVIYLPDIRSCVPTRIEWDGLHSSYKQKMEGVIKAKSNVIFDITGDDSNCNTKLDVVDSDGKYSTNQKCSSNSDGGGGGDAVDEIIGVTSGDTAKSVVTIDSDKKDDITELDSRDAVDNLNKTGNNTDNNNSSSSIADPDAEGTNDKDENTSVKRERTEYSELDPKTMKVSDLRDELEARNLSAKGLKPQLIARLTKVLKVEETEDQNNVDAENVADNIAVEEGDIDMTDILVIDEYDSTIDTKRKEEEIPKPMNEHERKLIEKRYQLPDRPKIIAHPSCTAMNGKFDCDVVSLSVLLEHRPEDSKEHCFEVLLFAQIFNEMIMRDFAFNIYKALYGLPHTLKDKSAGEMEKDKAKEKQKEKEKETKKHKKEDDKPKEKKLKIDDDGVSKHSQDSTNDEIEKGNTTIVNKDHEHKIDSEKEKDNKAMENSVKDKGKGNERAKEKVHEEGKEKGKDKDKGKEKEKDKGKEKEKEKENDKEKEKGKEKERDTKYSKDKKRKRREDESDDDTHSVKSNSRKKEKERPKYYTADPELLLSFVYFDQTHCGYIFGKDIEDLFYTIGLNLSRAQIKKIVSKVVTIDSLFYRKLTDKPKDDVKIDCNDSGNNKQDNLNLNIQKIAEGNKLFLPIFKNDPSQLNISGLRTDNKDDDRSVSETVPESLNGMLSYKGGLIDIEQLLEQMKRSEKAREDTEILLVNLRKNNAELLSNVTRSKDKIKDLQSDVKSCARKLNETEQSLNNHMKKSSEYHSILTHIHDKVAPVFMKTEKLSKNDVSRDKDKERDKKDKVRPCVDGNVGGNDKEQHCEKDKEKVSKGICDTDKEDSKDGIKKELKKVEKLEK